MTSEMLPRLMVFGGLLLAALGGLIWLAQKAGFRGLPGDIAIQREGFSFYFPIVTCIVLSLILTIVLNLLGRR